jgi:hypothetical protein
MDKRVAIFGGGIGGLTAAHYLSKLGWGVHVYEAKHALGGLARSSRDPDGCATEYCWRVYFSFYDNFLQVLSEIPTTSIGTSRDNLVVYEHANLMAPLSLKDRILGYYHILKGITSCDQRLDALDDVAWWDALGSTSNSNLFRTIGPWLGMDRMKGSFKSVIKVGIEQQIIPSYLASFGLGTYNDYITSEPTSEAIFTPWQRSLEPNVTFHFGDDGTLVSLRSQDGRIVEATTKTGRVSADYFILAVPVEVLEKIIINSPSIDGDRIRLGAISRLKDTCLHTQISMQLYFRQPISLGGKNAFLLVESPWDLIVVSYDQSYGSDTPLCEDIPEAKGGWSVAATTAYIPGLNGKTLMECNEREIQDEMWNQLVSNPYLQNLVYTNNGFELDKTKLVKWTGLWPTFYNDPLDGKLKTTEPKFTNNAGSYKLRPSFRTYIPNLFISTAYIKETIDIFSMEAACIAGKRVAHAIDERSPDATIRPRPLILVPFRTIDSIFWRLGLPNPILLVFVLVMYMVAVSIHRMSQPD